MFIVLFIFGGQFWQFGSRPKICNERLKRKNDENSVVSDNYLFINNSLYFSQKEESILLYTNRPFQN